MNEQEIENLHIDLEHRTAEVAELRAIIRRLHSAEAVPDEPCPHTYVLIAGEDGARCMMCEASLVVSFDARR
jgi:hypothetical protein